MHCIAACTTSQNRLSIASDFTAHSLAEGGMIVAGVAGEEEERQLAFAEILYQRFSAVHPKYRFLEPEKSFNALGAQLYAQMLESYRFHGKARIVFMSQLQHALPGYRYVVYAHIQADEIQRRAEVMQGRYRLMSRRLQSVVVQIYDLEQRKHLVWGGALSHALDQEKILYGVTSEQINTHPQWFPEPPGRAKVLEVIFTTFAQQLPALPL